MSKCPLCISVRQNFACWEWNEKGRHRLRQVLGHIRASLNEQRLAKNREDDYRETIPGTRSLMNICPVVRERWNRLGVRLVIQNTWVINAVVAIWEANSLRIRHNALGPFMVRIIYWNKNKMGWYFCKSRSGFTHAGNDIFWNQFDDDLIQNLFLQCRKLSLVNLSRNFQELDRLDWQELTHHLASWLPKVTHNLLNFLSSHQNRVLPCDAQAFTMFVVDVTESDIWRIGLQQAKTRAQRDSCR